MSGGIALALLAVLALVLQRRVLRPLRRLQVAVGSNGNGTKTLPVHVQGPSEIAQLAAEFNSISNRTRAEGIQNAHLAAASHELRGPLNVVIGMADTMIERDGQLDDEVRSQLLRRISSSGKKMDRILTDLFEVMRNDDGSERLDRTPVDLEALARKTVEEVEGLEGRTVEIEASGLVRDLDARMVARILDNLVSNAARHAGPASKIWVNVSDCEDGVTMAVDDEGPGVPAEERQRIFERFERGSGVMVSGLGIGLSVVSRFAQLHGGRAWVEDRPGGGASFRVFLPKAAS